MARPKARKGARKGVLVVRRHLVDVALAILVIAALVFAAAVIVKARASTGAGARTTATASSVPSAPASSSVATPTGSATTRTPTAVFIGDSYTAGTGGEGTRWTTLVAQREGWQEVNLGYPGTGYAKDFHAPSCPDDGCPDYLGVVSRAIAAHPAIVVVSGGRNDLADPDAATANISKIFEQLHRGLPQARVIAISPFYDDRRYPTGLRTLGSKVRTAVEAVGGEYVDVGSPLQDSPDLLSDGGVNPNAAGYRALAAAVSSALPAS